ncbi:MAG: site-specific integrase [Candidatus Hydrogenedentes bacterium]|nr:site-specific integrase [Candidatus Hydrogenedentota bacterium]
MQGKITKQFIKGLQVRAQPYEVADTELPGFLLRVQPTGVMTYYARYRRKDGTRGRVKIGPASVLTPDQARDDAKKKLASAVQGADPAAEKKTAKIHTLRTFLSEVYEPYLNANSKTGKARIAMMKAAFADFLDKPLDQITAWNVEKWRTEKMKPKDEDSKRFKPATPNRAISALKAAYNRAVEWKLLRENPLKSVRPLKEDVRSKVRYLEKDEFKRLIAALDKREQKLRKGRTTANEWRRDRNYPEFPDLNAVRYADYLKPMVLLSLNTGMRRGELFNLLWTDIDFARKTLTVRGEGAKTSTTRHIPLNSTALNVLHGWRSQNAVTGLIFTNELTGGRFDNVNSAWERILKKAKVTGFRWHDMRHDFASKLVMAGVDLNTVRELLGHTDMKLTLRYAHLAPHIKAEAVERLVI